MIEIKREKKNKKQKKKETHIAIRKKTNQRNKREQVNGIKGALKEGRGRDRQKQPVKA